MTIPHTTQKQQEILTLIPRFRFIARPHIQSLLKHKDEAQINRWLKELQINRYVKRIYDNKIVGKNRTAAIFSLDNNGVRYVKTQGIYDDIFIHKLYWDKKRSDGFIDHCLLIATIGLELERKTSDGVSYEYATGSDFSIPDSEFHFLKNSTLPVDLVFWKKENGKQTKYFLLTVFDETLPKYRLRKRIRDYKEFYYNNEWENNMDAPFPILFFIGETKERFIYAKRYAKTLFDDEIPKDLSFNFATDQDAKEIGVTGAIWEGI